MSALTVVLYGMPPKDMEPHANRLAHAFGCKNIISSWVEGETVHRGTLHLSYTRPKDRVRGARVISIHDLTIPPEEYVNHHTTCGTAFLAAERTLRIIERAVEAMHPIENVDVIHSLCVEAGPIHNKAAIEKSDAHRAYDDEVPF